MMMILEALWEEGVEFRLVAEPAGVEVGEVERAEKAFVVTGVEKMVVVTGGGGVEVDVVCIVTTDEEASGILALDRRGEKIKAIPAESVSGTVTVWMNTLVVSAALAAERRKTPRYSRIR